MVSTKIKIDGIFKEKLPSAHISIEHHPNIFTIGDLHGDLRTLLFALRLTQCVSYDKDLDNTLNRCPEKIISDGNALTDVLKYKNAKRERYPLTEIEVNSIKWTGGKNAILLLGDVLDNRRHRSHDIYGTCAMAGTQALMLEIIHKLQQEAKRKGGKIVWVLGNHDIENAMSSGNKFCLSYAPQRVKIKRTDSAFNTCSPDGFFSKKWQEYIRGRIITMRAVAIAKIHWKDGSAILAMHGGICDIEILNDMLPYKYKLSRYTPHDNIRKINQLYWNALNGNPVEMEFITRHDVYSMLPTWCRPKEITHQTLLRSYFGTANMVVAHTIQNEINCSKSPHGDAILCRVDVGMSRAFKNLSNSIQLLHFTYDKHKKQIHHTILKDERLT